eukprot:SAG11_NODE_8723_length_983_cov_0.687783_1_plen_33_part_01
MGARSPPFPTTGVPTPTRGVLRLGADRGTRSIV